MNWKRLFNRLNGAPASHDRDLDEELAFHRGMKERELIAKGMSPGDARDAARRALGNLTLAREDARAEWTFSWIGDLGRDLHYAFRTLAAQPSFTAAAVLALVLGIGVNAIVFNIYNALALAPWAVRDAGRVVRVLQEEIPGVWNGFSWPAYRYLRDHTQTLAGLTAFEQMACSVKYKDAAWMGEAVAADENYFDVLGTGFAAGRGFTPLNGNLREPAPEVVLHYDEWMRRFGGDRGVIGQWIDLNGHRLQIVGVAAEGFSGPVPVSPALWVPAPWRDIFHPGTAQLSNPDSCCTRAIGRLKNSVTAQQAQAELNGVALQFDRANKRTEARVVLTPPTLLADPRSQRESTPVFLAMGVACLLILLLACANVANLQLARSVSRSREFAVRTSLGASRGRILRQLLVEAALLGAIAALLTALVSAWAPGAIMREVAAATDANGALNFRFENDWRVIVFVAAISMFSTLLFGLAPALQATRGVSAGMQQGGRSTAMGRQRGILLALQVILCTVLLSGAALLLRALDAARHTDTGFAYSRTLVVNPNLDSSGLAEAQTVGVTDALVERLRTLPEVESVAYAIVVPLGRRNDTVGIDVPGMPHQVVFNVNHVSANFFAAMSIPMTAGRTFLDSEELKGNAMLVNETLARRIWPNQNPIGKQLMDHSIVGVARDFHIRELGPAQESAAFFPAKPSRDTQLLVRSRNGVALEALAAQVTQLARGMDRRLSMVSTETYSEIIGRAAQVAVLVAAIAAGLSALALVLACVGIYGVAAYSVSQRTREIGVRMALGARPRSIARMVLTENLRVVTIGAVLGIAGAVAFARLLTTLLFGVQPGDPLALLGTISVLLAASAAAAWLPARRAASVDPAITLRHD